MDDSKKSGAAGSSRATSETVVMEDEENRPKRRRGLGKHRLIELEGEDGRDTNEGGRLLEEGGRLLELERTVAAQGARMDAFMERMLKRDQMSQDGRPKTPEEGRSQGQREW